MIDLEAAAVEVESRRAAWLASGLAMGPVTWQDRAERWPRTLKTDRGLVAEPDSIGVEVHHDGDPVLQVVLYAGGWADVDLVDRTAYEITSEAPKVPDVASFGRLLDSLARRLTLPNLSPSAAPWP